MKIKEAIDRTIRTRHFGIIIECLKVKDGLLYDDLYVDYCKRCEQEGVIPMVRCSLHKAIERYYEKRLVKIEFSNLGIGTYRRGKRVWLVK